MTQTLFAGVFLLASAMAAPAAAQFSEPPQLDKPQAGFYRLKIGKVDVIAVNDGAAIFDVHGVVPNEKKAAAVRMMAKSLVKSPVQASVNASRVGLSTTAEGNLNDPIQSPDRADAVRRG